MFVSIAPELVAIERRLGRTERAEEFQMEIDAMTAAIEKDGWDGEWFVRAYDAMGRKVGNRNADSEIYHRDQRLLREPA